MPGSQNPLLKSHVLKRLESLTEDLSSWQLEEALGSLGALEREIDITSRLRHGSEWVGEVEGCLKTWDPKVAVEFRSLVANEGVRSPAVAEFLNRERGRLRSETELESARETPQSAVPRPVGRRVFLVHGHDEGFKETVARFVEKLGLTCIILHERANMGRTLIEKFLAQVEEVDFAIALWTADDVGRANTEENLKPRARQNVVFETGFFVGELGRERVCVIYESGVELPSDYVGVTYVSKSNWKEELLRELKAAKLPLDTSSL